MAWQAVLVDVAQLHRDVAVGSGADVGAVEIHLHGVDGDRLCRLVVKFGKRLDAQVVGAGIEAVETQLQLAQLVVFVDVDVPHILTAAGLQGAHHEVA